jgi:probable phosphoglycerate mutase
VDFWRGDLFLIRHGQTPCTVDGRFCGTHDGVLTPIGLRMAERLAGHPALGGVDLLLSSPSNRAVATAELIGESAGVPVKVDDRLRETSFGDWEDRLPAEVDRAAHDRWTHDPALFAPPGGEPGLTVLARSVAAVRDALDTADRVAVVTHKAPVRLVLSYFLGLPPARYRDIGNVSVGSLSWLRFTDGRAVLKAIGDVGHLPQEWRADPDHAK